MENNRLFTLVITLISISIGPARPMPSNKNLWQDGTYPKWLMEKLCVCFGYCSESLGNQTKGGGRGCRWITSWAREDLGWATKSQQHNGCEEFDEAENRHDFEGLVRKCCSRSLADKSQQGTLGIYIFLMPARFWPLDFPGVAVIHTSWVYDQLPLIIPRVAVPGAAEILLLFLVLNESLASKQKLFFFPLFFWRGWMIGV